MKLQWLLAVLVVGGLTLTVTSCKDDDKNEQGGEPTQAEIEKQVEASTVFMNVVGQLTDGLELSDDWQNATFEPTYGTPEEGNAHVRVKVVNNIEGAARLYGYLVSDQSVNAETQTHTYHNDAVGTLTYKRSTDGQSLATVDVHIAQMPHLQKIVYKTPKQLGTNTLWNGNFDGSAYYRFGDVIHRSLPGGYDEYWVCVRPAFSPEGKGDTHWISLSALPEDNLFHHAGSNGTDYYLPTKIGNYPKYEMCFAEMISAILNPAQWRRNLQENPNLDFFNDFDLEYNDCHNDGFWSQVATGWEEKNIFEHLFPGLNKTMLAADINDRGLHLLYSGYSWKTMFSWTASLYERIYTGMNLTTAIEQTHSKNLEKMKLDMSGRYWGKRDTNKDFFGDNKPRWVIRHATGKQLGGHDNPKKRIEGFDETYIYNQRFVADKNYDDNDPVILDAIDMINGYFVPGDVVKDFNGNRWVCVQAAHKDQDEAIMDYVPYSYFISFNTNALKTDNDDFGNLPSRNLAFQMMYELTMLYSNWLKNRSDNDATGYAMHSYKERGFFDLENLIPFHTYQSAEHKNNWVKVFIMNAMYKNRANKNCIARLVYDMDAVNPVSHGRDMQLRLYDMYLVDDNTDERIMYVDDLYDEKLVETYAKENAKWSDKNWCIPPYISDASMRLKEPEERSQYITSPDRTLWHYFMDDYKFGQMSEDKPGLNMYLEPVFTFAVKRVRDTGTNVWNFDDGTRFALLYKQPREMFENFTDPGVNAHKRSVKDAIFIDDILEDFGVSNQP